MNDSGVHEILRLSPDYVEGAEVLPPGSVDKALLSRLSGSRGASGPESLTPVSTNTRGTTSELGGFGRLHVAPDGWVERIEADGKVATDPYGSLRVEGYRDGVTCAAVRGRARGPGCASIVDMAARSHRRPCRASFGVIAVLVAGAVGCAPLETLQQSGCGDAVVAEDGTEDCDRYVPPELAERSEPGKSMQCGAPGTAHECRFVCDFAAGNPSCPSQWGCGHDGVCRRPSGELREADGSPWGFVNDSFALGDTDGDGLRDALGHAGARLAVRFGEPSSSFGPETSIATRTALAPPQFVDLSSDGRTDAVEAQLGGLSTLLGRGNRTLAPVLHPTQKASAVAIVPVRAQTAALNGWVVEIGTATLSVHSFPGSAGASDPKGLPEPCVQQGATSVLWGRIPVGDVKDRGSDSLVLGCAGASELFVYDVVPISLGRAELSEPQAISLTDGWKVCRGAQFVDIDGDGLRDIIVDVATSVSPDAYGHCDGLGLAMAQLHPGQLPGEPPQFGSTAQAAPSESVMGASCDLPSDGTNAQQVDAWPLATGDLDADGRQDFVLPSGIHRNRARVVAPGQLPFDLVAKRCTVFGWDVAEVGDFNADGALDVVAGQQGSFGLDLLHGDGAGLFGSALVQTVGSLGALRGGDFNGDNIADVAVVEFGLGATAEYRLSLLLGGGAVPSAVEPVGSIGQPWSVEPGELWLPLVAPRDTATDLLVLSTLPQDEGESGWATLILGGSPQMAAPRRLEDPNSTSTDSRFLIPLAVAAGRFASTSVEPTATDSADSLLAIGWAIHDGPAGSGIYAAALPLGPNGTIRGQCAAESRQPEVAIPNGSEGFQIICSVTEVAPLGTNGADILIAVDRTAGCAAEPATCAGADRCPPRIARFEAAPEPNPTGIVEASVANLGGLDADGEALGGIAQLEVPHERLNRDGNRGLPFEGDVDGDGLLDLVATFVGPLRAVDATRLRGERVSTPGAGLAIYWGTADGSGFDLDHPLVVNEFEFPLAFEPPPGNPLWFIPFGAALIELDADPDQELALVTSKGLYLFDVVGRALQPLRGPAEATTALGWITAVAVEDVDRDGLDDLVFATPDDFTVLRGVACAPGSPLLGCRRE